jgi:hypothetical protein
MGPPVEVERTGRGPPLVVACAAGEDVVTDAERDAGTAAASVSAHTGRRDPSDARNVASTPTASGRLLLRKRVRDISVLLSAQVTAV